MTDDDGVFVYNVAQLVSCRFEIMLGPLDILQGQSGEACIEVAIDEEMMNDAKRIAVMGTSLQNGTRLFYTEIEDDFSVCIHHTQST